jgi:hypothetical protein
MCRDGIVSSQIQRFKGRDFDRAPLTKRLFFPQNVHSFALTCFRHFTAFIFHFLFSPIKFTLLIDFFANLRSCSENGEAKEPLLVKLVKELEESLAKCVVSFLALPAIPPLPQAPYRSVSSFCFQTCGFFQTLFSVVDSKIQISC